MIDRLTLLPLPKSLFRQLCGSLLAYLGLVVLAITPVKQVLAQAVNQSRVDYQLDVKLEPADHLLCARGLIVFHNRSGKSLDSIPVQLWANAYADRESPYGQQKRRFGNTKFYYATPDQRGGYRDLRFSGDEVASSSSANKELTWVRLINPLRSGDSARISIDYTLRIPITFSRMGRDGEAYYLTQWYPKVPVLDSLGWHPMPYLDFGEYFNEFGDYRIAVSVPAGGMVAATGIPDDTQTAALLAARINLTEQDTNAVDGMRFDTSQTHTFRYRARNVTDFAVFVNPAFRVSSYPARLKAREIPAYAFYPKSEATTWKYADSLLARAAVYADSLVGAYPHPQISAVSAPLGVGGGMEYPMITVIGPTGSVRELDEVLAHEGFHNWFALTLATNERERAWMDEGVTTWIEQRYMERYYGPQNALGEVLPKFVGRNTPYDEGSLLHKLLATAKRQPAPDTHSDSLTEFGYGYAAYTQPGLLFAYAEHALGRSEFDAGMQRYYSNWQMRHPGPADLQTALEGADNSGSLDWLFDSLILDNVLPDYRLLSARRDGALVTVRIENRAALAIPLILGYQLPDDTYRELITLPGFLGEQSFQMSVPEESERVAIDPLLRSPEVARNDNYRAITGITPGIEPLALHLLTAIGRPDRNEVAVIPFVTYNNADRLLLGLGIHNYTVDQGPTRFYVLPQIATRDASLNGIAGVRHSRYSNDSWWRELEIGLDARQYHYHYNKTYDFNDRFQRATLSAKLFLASAPGLRRDHRIEIRAHAISQLYAVGRNAERRLFIQERRSYSLVDLNYYFQRRDPITPWSTRLGADGGKGFARLTGELDYAWRYQRKARFVRVRAFAGGFAFRQNPVVQALLLPNGVTGFLNNQYDYTFEENIIDRAQTSQQVFTRDGSLTLPFLLPSFASTTWLTSLSASVDAPFRLLAVQPSLYADLAVYPDNRGNKAGIVAPATAGVRLSLPRDIFSISFPVLNSGFVKESLAFTRVDAKYSNRIAFSLNLNVLNIDNLLRELRG